MRELTKSRDRMLFGVAGGMAEYFEMDKSLVRAIWLFGGIFFPPLILAYVVLAVVIPAQPRAPQAWHQSQAWQQPQAEPEPQPEFRTRPSRKQMVKSYDRWISGVCGGIAEYFDIDPLVIRALFLAAIFLGFGSGLVVYLILAIVMPRPAYQYR